MVLSRAELRIAEGLTRGAALIPVRALENAATNDDALDRATANLASLIIALNDGFDAIISNGREGTYKLVDLGATLGTGAPVLAPLSDLILVPGVWDALPINSQVETVWKFSFLNNLGAPSVATIDIVIGNPPATTSPIAATLMITLPAGPGTGVTASVLLKIVKSSAAIGMAEFAIGTEVDGASADVTSPLGIALPVSGNGITFAAVYTGAVNLNLTTGFAQGSVIKTAGHLLRLT